MQLANIPLRFAKVWGVDADGPYIRTVPVDSQIGTQDGAASFQTGFVPDNFTAVSAGGVPPFGQDFNGALNIITAWEQWVQAGGPIGFNSSFASDVGGYPKGSILSSNILLGAQWVSTADSNTTDPDDPLTSANWRRVGLPAGALVPLLTAVPSNLVQARGDFTIGSASSGATYAAADALFLFVANWSNSQLPIFTSAGSGTTRGANAVADFVANKRLQMPEGRGTGLIGVDAGTSSNLSGVPIIAGNPTTAGSAFGGNLHQLTTAQIPTITPAGTITNGAITLNGLAVGTTGNIAVFQQASTPVAGSGAAPSASQAPSLFSGTPFGGNGSHNNVERSLGVNWGQVL